MRFSNALSLLAVLSVSAASRPHSNSENDPSSERHGCLSDHDAQVIRDRWIGFFVNFDPAIAKKSVVHDFKLYSETTNFLNPDLTPAQWANPQYDSRDSFIAGQSNQYSGAHNPELSNNDIFPIVAYAHGCDFFTFRWAAHFKDVTGASTIPIAGIDFALIAKDSYQIDHAYSEYNNGQFLLENLKCSFVSGPGGACGTQFCQAGGCGAAPTTPKRNVFERRQIEGEKIGFRGIIPGAPGV